MIEQRTVDKILHGEPVLIEVVTTDEKKLLSFRLWLEQFRREYGGKQFINWSSTVLRNNSEKLVVNIGAIPIDQREYFAGTLASHGKDDSSFTINEKPCEPAARP